MQVREIAIVDACRSPITKSRKGALNALTPLQITAQVVNALMERNPKVPKDRFEMVVAGTAYPEGEQGLNIARLIALKCGFPVSVAGVTVNQFCASSQQAAMIIHDAMALGKGDAGLAVGLEHMARVPQGGFNPSLDSELYERNVYIGMGDTAEVLAEEFSIPRDAQEAFAMRSHEKALKAWGEGAFAKEVIPIKLPKGGVADRDEFPREPNPEKLKSLKPAFRTDGTVTAGTSSPLSVGVAALVLMPVEVAQELGVTPRATILSTAVAGVDYERMGLGPVPASEKALKRAGLTIDDMDVIELNEAFASQSLAVIQQAGWEAHVDKINPLGGALALGHPLGMSGARILGTALTALERSSGTHALVTMCVGGGQGATTILKRWGA